MHLRKTIWTVAGILAVICAGVFFYHINNKSNVPSPAASVSYLDEKEHSLDLKSVPGSYLKRADKQGKLERIYYETKDYDDDEAEMEKYAVVYTPYGYDAGKKYDVMYMLHGHTGSADTWLGSPEEPNYTKNCLDHLIEDGYVKPIIVVSMTYYDNNEDENTDNYDMDLLEPFGKELKQDIIPAVESRYSTYAEGTDESGLTAGRNHRIFCGFSMGGVTASYRICDSMDYFRYFIPLSGSFYWSDMVNSNEDGFNSGEYMADEIEKQGYGANDFFIFSEAGEDDFGYDVVKEQVNDMQDTSEMFRFGMPGDEGINCAYGIGEGEEHDRHGRTTALYNILPMISDMIYK